MTKNIKILDRQFYPAGTVVIEQGTAGSRAFIVESGKVEVFVNDAHGNQVVVTELGPESMFGEMAIIRDEKRMASVRTKEDCVLIIISAHELRKTMQASGSYFNRVMHVARERLQDTATKLLKKERKLAAIEKAAPLSLKNVALNIAKAERVIIKQEILTVDKMTFPAGTVVIQQGTVGKNAFLIESGRVQVFKTDESGKEIVLAELGAKALIGEIGALSQRPRSASVRTLENTVLIPITASELQVIMSTSEDLHRNLMSIIADRLKDTHRKLFGRELGGGDDIASSLPSAGEEEARDVSVLDKLKGLLEKTTKE